MKFNFSLCSESYSSPKRLPKERSDRENFSLITWKPKCLRREKGKKKQGKKQQQKLNIVQKLTLEEWFGKSPIVENGGNYNYQHFDYKHISDSREYSFSLGQLFIHSGSDYLSEGQANASFSDSAECSFSLEKLLTDSAECSFSLEKLLKQEEVDFEEKSFSSLTRSQSSVEKRKGDTICHEPVGYIVAGNLKD